MKKNLMIVLALAMMGAVLVGCSSDAADDTATTGATTTAGTEDGSGE